MNIGKLKELNIEKKELKIILIIVVILLTSISGYLILRGFSPQRGKREYQVRNPYYLTVSIEYFRGNRELDLKEEGYYFEITAEDLENNTVGNIHLFNFDSEKVKEDLCSENPIEIFKEVFENQKDPPTPYSKVERTENGWNIIDRGSGSVFNISAGGENFKVYKTLRSPVYHQKEIYNPFRIRVATTRIPHWVTISVYHRHEGTNTKIDINKSPKNSSLIKMVEPGDFSETFHIEDENLEGEIKVEMSMGKGVKLVET